MGVGRGE